MRIEDAQKDMRTAYLDGGSGVLVSGIVWLVSGILAIYTTAQITILVFFFGGMLIHPLGIVLDKLFKRTGKHQKENPFGKLALESTILLFIGLFIAYVIFQQVPNWFFPVMLMIIGGRYLIFQTIYGLKVYWALGGVLIAAGVATLMTNQPFNVPVLAGGIIELVFSVFIIRKSKDRK